MVIKNCEHCGKCFKIAYKFRNQKFCNRKCYLDYKKECSKKYIKLYKCKICGKRFKDRKSKNRICCSTKCQYKLQSRRMRGKKRIFSKKHRENLSKSAKGNTNFLDENGHPWNYGKSHSLETRKKLSQYRGHLASGWIDGRSKGKQYPFQWNRKLKSKIRKKYAYTCQLCDKKFSKYSNKLHVHHIDYNKENCKENNLITLCVSCHCKTNSNRDYWENFFKKK